MEGSFVPAEKYIEWITNNFGAAKAFAALWECIGLISKRSKRNDEQDIKGVS